MDCGQALDMIHDDENRSLYDNIRLYLHLFFCSRCADVHRKLEICRDLLRSGFFPPSPSFEDIVMELLSVVPSDAPPETLPEESEAPFETSSEIPLDASLLAGSEIPGGFSFRAWVIAGFFILISLTTSFFGMDFIIFTADSGSFLVPLGITIGIVLTIYGAFFIGSHLKELVTHFKIH